MTPTNNFKMTMAAMFNFGKMSNSRLDIDLSTKFGGKIRHSHAEIRDQKSKPEVIRVTSSNKMSGTKGRQSQ